MTNNQSNEPENREQTMMSNTKQQIEEMLNKVSEYNKLSGKGHGDLKDNCYICGISPSGLIEAIDRLVTEARIEELRLHATDCKDCIQLVNDITQLFIDEGWRVPQKPLDQKKAEELLEKLYWNTK